jgi:hypothetical protein
MLVVTTTRDSSRLHQLVSYVVKSSNPLRSQVAELYQVTKHFVEPRRLPESDHFQFSPRRFNFFSRRTYALEKGHPGR